MNIKLLTHKYFWRELWRKIRDFFCPKNKWLTKVIPNGWHDKPELLEKVMFAFLVDFVENEGGENNDPLYGIFDEEWAQKELDAGHFTLDSFYKQRQVRTDLEQAYKIIKEELPQLNEAFNNSYPKPLKEGDSLFSNMEEETSDGVKVYKMKSCEEIYGMSYEEAYAEHNRLEKLISEKTTWVLEKIVQHRGHLWT